MDRSNSHVREKISTPSSPYVIENEDTSSSSRKYCQNALNLSLGRCKRLISPRPYMHSTPCSLSRDDFVRPSATGRYHPLTPVPWNGKGNSARLTPTVGSRCKRTVRWTRYDAQLFHCGLIATNETERGGGGKRRGGGVGKRDSVSRAITTD